MDSIPKIERKSSNPEASKLKLLTKPVPEWICEVRQALEHSALAPLLHAAHGTETNRTLPNTPSLLAFGLTLFCRRGEVPRVIINYYHIWTAFLK